MKVFVFDVLAYGEQLDHIKIGSELPYPLSSRHFKPEVAVRTYAEHLDAWELIGQVGYDGLGFNEHHCSPHGLMNSPNLMAASAVQRRRRCKLLIYGNRLPLHEPLRLAEELAMLDCLSIGRLISGFARGIPGAMPQEMFVEQIRRFGRDVLPILQAHEITHVPGAGHVPH